MTEKIRHPAPLTLESEPPKREPKDESKFWWYCLEEFHPGAPPYSQDPLYASRVFGTDTDQGCPVCPACGREVSATSTLGPDVPPPAIVEFRQRWISQQSHVR